MDIKKIIYNQLTQKKNVFLIGSTDSGKSWFVINDLIPFLKMRKHLVRYFNNCNELPNEPIDIDYLIIDEVETLQDRKILEELHPAEIPYYSQEYIDKVFNWFKKLRCHKQPCVYIITRNDYEAVKYLINNVKKTDWDQRIIMIVNFIENWKIRYRLANKHDLQGLIAANVGNLGEVIDYNLLPFLIKEKRVYCAEINGEIATLLYWQSEFLGISDTWFIRQITTKLEWRHKGIATLLLKAFLNYAKDMQIRKIFTDVRYNNIIAQNLFMKIGAVKSGSFFGIDSEAPDDNWILFRFDLVDY